jgi:hypothetical protein
MEPDPTVLTQAGMHLCWVVLIGTFGSDIGSHNDNRLVSPKIITGLRTKLIVLIPLIIDYPFQEKIENWVGSMRE